MERKFKHNLLGVFIMISLLAPVWSSVARAQQPSQTSYTICTLPTMS